jgi:hypothetical protein
VIFTKVSKQYAASIFRVEEQTKRGKTGIDVGNGIAGLGFLSERIGLRRGGENVSE